MAEITIDARSLSYTRFFIPEANTGLLDGAQAPTVQLEPGLYGFQQMTPSRANFTFVVTAAGTVDYEAACDPFLSGRGTTVLRARGFAITFDARALSHDLLPTTFGSAILGRDRTHVLTLVPATGYEFQPASGIIADFRFDVDMNGQVRLDPHFAGFAEANGANLTMHGYRVTIDGTALSHALLPVSMLGNVSVLGEDRAHEMTFIPAAGYGFQPASGIVADFRFDLDVDGHVAIDPRFAGFAEASGLTLTMHGYRVTIDGTALSHALLPVSMLGNVSVLSEDRAHEMTFIPAAGYGFQPASDIVADFRFDLDVDGHVAIDPRFAGFAEASGLTLTMHGYRVTIDGTALSHALLPVSMLGNVSVLSEDRAHEMTFIPAAGYGFQPASGIVADFRFDLDVDGHVAIDPRFAGFAEASGLTLTMHGYRVTIDGTALSHALLPVSMLGNVSVLSEDRAHEMTFIPAAGYGFQPASGIVADFRFDLDVDGHVAIDPRFAGFAEASGLTLTMHGYRVTIDGTALSHALLPVSMLGNVGVLSQDRTHVMTFIPAAGYGFQPAAGMVADFRFELDVNGALLADSRFAGFSRINGRTLTITGYRVTLDTGELTRDLVLSVLNWSGGILSPGLHDFAVVPAAGYRLAPVEAGPAQFHFDVDARGRITLTDAPGGVTAISDRRFCDVPDSVASPLQIQTYGAPGGRWPHGHLTVSLDLTNAPAFGDTPTVEETISIAFFKWHLVLPEFFIFTFPPGDTNIRVAFGGTGLNPRFGAPGGVLGSAQYPQNGRMVFDSSEAWTPELLESVALHEIGHLLGIAHSNDSRSLMFPLDSGRTAIDAETQEALRNLYGWRPQIPLSDRATSDRPAMAVTTHGSLTFSFSTLHMVWKGSLDDQSIYESTLENNVWTPQRLVAGIGSSQSPAVASFPLNDGTPSTGLIMAWKGVDDDQALYYTGNTGAGWNAPSPRPVPGIGSSHRPALADFGLTHMVWKGVEDDHNIYWSRLTSAVWEPQRNVPGVGTTSSPALVVFQNRLFMFWKGVEGDSRVYFSSLDAFPDATWQPQRVASFQVSQASGSVFVEIGTSHGPSVTVHSDRILLAWKGIDGDSAIYFSLFDGNAFTGQIQVADVGTSEGPCVCGIGAFTHMTWKGIEGDNGVYWSTLGGA